MNLEDRSFLPSSATGTPQYPRVTVRSAVAQALEDFSAEDGGTRIELSGNAQVSGVVARVGQRLLGGASRMLMNQFFGCLKSRVEEGATDPP